MAEQRASIRLGALARAATAALLDLVFPPHCVACGRLGEWLCAPCLASAARISRAPLCPRCGLPLRRPGPCPACRRRPLPLHGLRAWGWHRSPLQQAIHAFKYEGVRVLAAPLAALLHETHTEAGWPAEGVVEVPLHRLRERSRGYNQSTLLARELARRADLPHLSQALVRRRDTPPQVGLNRAERWRNVAGAFEVQASEVSGRRLLLVDDVLTTGATLAASAEALLRAGAREVRALTVARAGGAPHRPENGESV